MDASVPRVWMVCLHTRVGKLQVTQGERGRAPSWGVAHVGLWFHLPCVLGTFCICITLHSEERLWKGDQHGGNVWKPVWPRPRQARLPGGPGRLRFVGRGPAAVTHAAAEWWGRRLGRPRAWAACLGLDFRGAVRTLGVFHAEERGFRLPFPVPWGCLVETDWNPGWEQNRGRSL